MTDSNMDWGYVDGQAVHRKIHRKCSRVISAVVAVDLFIVVMSMLQPVPSVCFNCTLKQYELVFTDYQDFVSAVHTVLGAAVIFYYSVKDNQKVGIPPRTIMSYSFGSWAIPLLFAFSTVLVMDMIFVRNRGWFIWVLVSLAASVLTQILCVALILISTSYNYDVHVICNAEIRQFQYMRHDQDLNPIVWIYMMRHLEQAVKSDDLMGDRMVLSQKLLRTPFYEKEQLFNKRLRLDFSRVYVYPAFRFYGYYYDNLVPVFQYLASEKHKEERMKMYQLLYELVREVDEEYYKLENDGFQYLPHVEAQSEEEEKVTPLYGADGERERKNECRKKLLIIVSAIMNAVLFAGPEDSEAFCNHILNECMKQDELRGCQVKLYFLYQELLHIKGSNSLKLEHVGELNGNVISQAIGQDEQKLYWDIWEIWCRDTNLDVKVQREYLYRALESLEGNSLESETVTYIVMQLKKVEEVPKWSLG